jgi:hypothetical protein
MPLGDPFLPQPSPELILEEWKNLYMPQESRPEKQPVCIHKSTCTYVDRNTYCFYERKGIHCVHYFPKSDGVLLNISSAGAPKRQSMIEHDQNIAAISIKKVLDALDKQCEIAAREYVPDPDKGEFASDSHCDPFNEVREWIRGMRR